MSFDLWRAKQPDFQHKKNFKGYYTFQFHFRPLYAARQSQSRCCFIYDKFNHADYNFWYNPVNPQF